MKVCIWKLKIVVKQTALVFLSKWMKGIEFLFVFLQCNVPNFLLSIWHLLSWPPKDIAKLLLEVFNSIYFCFVFFFLFCLCFHRKWCFQHWGWIQHILFILVKIHEQFSYATVISVTGVFSSWRVRCINIILVMSLFLIHFPGLFVFVGVFFLTAILLAIVVDSYW